MTDRKNQITRRETHLSRQEWEPSPPGLTPKEIALAKGKYWLPDEVDCKPDIVVEKPRHRKSKFAQDFEDNQ